MRRSSRKNKLFFLVFFIVIAIISFYIFSSKEFEREKPEILVKEKIFWNFKRPIEINFRDNVGIKEFEIAGIDGNKKEIVFAKSLSEPKREVNISIEPEKLESFLSSKKFFLVVSVKDCSKWNYFGGNDSEKKILVVVDKKKPSQLVIAHSYKIRKGGAALVVFRCKDENLKDVYVETSFKKRFTPIPFYKEGYYVCLLAWPVQEKGFRAYVVSKDLAGNEARSYIRYFLLNKKYKVSEIKLKKRFLRGKVSQIALEYNKDGDDLEKFKFVNEELRNKNEKLITKLTLKVFEKQINSFYLHPFYPLKNAAAVASFGTHRIYLYDKEKVSESYHLGLDLASIKEAKIFASNKGKTVFVGDNGIYGNMVILYHGLGLYSLYGHCSTILVEEEEDVKRGEVIAQTGSSGLAFGDHLHFGIFVQGVAVTPLEWLSKNWIKRNILDIMRDAKKIINRSDKI